MLFVRNLNNFGKIVGKISTFPGIFRLSRETLKTRKLTVSSMLNTTKSKRANWKMTNEWQVRSGVRDPDLLTTFTSMVLSLTAPTQPVTATTIKQIDMTTIRVAGAKKWSSMKMLKSSNICEIVDPTAIRRKAVSCELSHRSKRQTAKSINKAMTSINPFTFRVLELIKWKSV